jgi:LmbE family N-acetylglucosaminyl deacetylase
MLAGGLSLVLGLGQSAAVSKGERVRHQSNHRPMDVVVIAHQDDWQLFMGDVLGRRLAAGDSVTFIYLTAGDDGRDSLYWRVRERAALASTRVAVLAVAADAMPRCTIAEVGSHSINRCTLGKTTSYFLRLPDGKRNGAGFPRYGNESLRKLRARTIRSITSVDSSTAYRNWEDVVATVRELAQPNAPAGQVVIHTTDPSVRVNPHDHYDHRIAGLLVADARKGRGWSAWYYVGYALSTRAANRSVEDAREKTVLFRAYDAEMIRANPKWSAYAEHPVFYSQCMERTSVRRVAGGRR